MLSCDVQGEPVAEVRWSSPPGANVAVDSNTHQLTITGASSENTGSYTCTATNPLGSSSDTATITVRGMYAAKSWPEIRIRL